MKTKRCTVCKKILPRTREYFYYVIKKNNTYQSRCIKCYNGRDKHTKNYDTKRCNSCKKTLPRTREYFYYQDKKENKFQTYCIECMRKKSSARHKEYKKKYSSSVPKKVIAKNLSDIKSKSKITVIEAEYLSKNFFNIDISISTIKKLISSENFGYKLKGSNKVIIDREAFERYLNGKETYKKYK